MIIDIITIFPEMFEGILNNSIIKRTIEKGIVTINVHDFRDYSDNKHNKVDDTTYGGGAGMLISPVPVINCLKSINGYKEAHKIITDPSGVIFNQNKAQDLSKYNHLIIVCGHYEGIDARVNEYIDEEISLGDFILTGGEIPALAIIDSVIRLIPGSISEDSIVSESFNNDLLEYSQYTKPVEFDGLCVPEVLLSGNHEEIRKYRLYDSLRNTFLKRPDLLEKHNFTTEEEEMLECIKLGLDYDATINKIKESHKKKRK